MKLQPQKRLASPCWSGFRKIGRPTVWGGRDQMEGDYKGLIKLYPEESSKAATGAVILICVTPVWSVKLQTTEA